MNSRAANHPSLRGERAAIKSRGLALAFRSIAFIIILAGIARISGIFTSSPAWKSFLFYTVQSNLLCLAWIGILIWWTARDIRRSGVHGTSTPSARFGGAVMLAITVTMLIYLVVLVPISFQQAGDYVPFSLTDNLIHIITPCLLILDWLLFSPKGSFRWSDPLLWALIPIAYLAFAFTYGGLGGEFYPGARYPYPFMNIEALGLSGVALWLAGLAVALIAVGYVYVAADRVMGRDRAKME